MDMVDFNRRLVPRFCTNIPVIAKMAGQSENISIRLLLRDQIQKSWIGI
jgi:hypothetical protein